MVRRRVCAVVLGVVIVAGAVVGVVPSAGAKGMIDARMVAGPGITAPIAVPRGDAVHELAASMRVYEAVWVGGTRTSLPIDPPVGDLGPRYTVEFALMVGANETLPIRQDLYPYAGGGPIVHTPGGQALERVERGAKTPCLACRTTTDVWYAADPEVLGVLSVDLDLPETRTRLVPDGASAPATRGWTTVRDDASGLQVRIPERWTSVAGTMLPVQYDPVMPLAVGTGTVEPQREGECGIVPQRSLEAVGPDDVFVGMYVNRGFASWGPTVAERPASFGAALPWHLGPIKCGGTTTARLRSLSFEDGGTRLTLMVATGPQASARTRAELVAVLDSLRTDAGKRST